MMVDSGMADYAIAERKAGYVTGWILPLGRASVKQACRSRAGIDTGSVVQTGQGGHAYVDRGNIYGRMVGKAKSAARLQLGQQQDGYSGYVG